MYFMEIILFIILLLYVLLLIFVIVGVIRITQKSLSDDTTRGQKISIVIAVRNEEDNIEACLTSLIHQNYDKNNFEIILVDDHSTDSTFHKVEQFIQSTSIKISVHQLAHKYSKKEALKEGVEKAQYPIIATTDADCILPTNWLSIISGNLKRETAMLLGPVVFSNKQGFLGAFQFLDMCALQGITFGLCYYQHPILNNGANLAYFKEDYIRVGGYDGYTTPSGDDVFLLEKFRSNNKEVSGIMNKEFIVVTRPEDSWQDFINQRLRWASKSIYYKNKLLLFFSSLMLIQNFIIFFIYIGMLFIEEIRFVGVILIISKWLIDFILLFLLSSFFKQRKKLLYFIPVQLVYPVYITTVAIASMFYKFKWKGRVFNE